MAEAAAWDQLDLAALLRLEPLAADRFCSRYHDANLNDRAYGGQVLGQALLAAAASVPPPRRATALQFLFLRGTQIGNPVEYVVTPLQDGKTFTSRHVRGSQDGAPVLDAHISFASDAAGPTHAQPAPPGIPGPESLMPLADMDPAYVAKNRSLNGYLLYDKPCVDFRLVAPEECLLASPAPARIVYWMRCARPLPQLPHMNEAALAYLSDWWTNFSSLVPHISSLSAERGLYVASLNHGVWFHRPAVAHEWLLVVSESPSAGAGRGLSIAHMYDRAGALVMSATQQCLMVERAA